MVLLLSLLLLCGRWTTQDRSSRPSIPLSIPRPFATAAGPFHYLVRLIDSPRRPPTTDHIINLLPTVPTRGAFRKRIKAAAEGENRTGSELQHQYIELASSKTKDSKKCSKSADDLLASKRRRRLASAAPASGKTTATTVVKDENYTGQELASCLYNYQQQDLQPAACLSSSAQHLQRPLVAQQNNSNDIHLGPSAAPYPASSAGQQQHWGQVASDKLLAAAGGDRSSAGYRAPGSPCDQLNSSSSGLEDNEPSRPLASHSTSLVCFGLGPTIGQLASTSYPQVELANDNDHDDHDDDLRPSKSAGGQRQQQGGCSESNSNEYSQLR